MNEYIESIFNIFKMIKSKATSQNDNKMKMIALMVYKYVLKLSKDYGINLKDISEDTNINLLYFFEYISYNNIELYDFNKIKIDDVDTNKNSDLERFILTHIYYITQK